MRLSELSSAFPIVVLRDADFESVGYVTHMAPKKRMLVFFENRKLKARLLRHPDVACVITTGELAAGLPEKYGVATADAPSEVFFGIHNHLAAAGFYWKDFPTEIAPDTQVHPAAYVAPRNVRIGGGTRVEPGAIILERSIIGRDVILRSGCVIGSEGFEYKRMGGRLVTILHGGGVYVHDRVEIQANSTVDCALFGGFTEIGEDTKIDNLVHIAHGVRIGKRCLIAASAMLAGAVTVGDDARIDPNASIAHEITIGDRAFVSLGSVVVKDVAADQKVTGNFAFEHNNFVRAWLNMCRSGSG